MTIPEGEPHELGCILCGSAEMDEMQDQRGLILPEPIVVLVCRNCGFVMQFAIRAGGPSVGYTQDGPPES